MAPAVLDLLELTEESETALQLKPFSRNERDIYLVNVLRQRYDYEKELEATKAEIPQLMQFVSDFASGVPKYIEELVGAMVKKGVVQKRGDDLRKGGKMGMAILNDFLENYSSGITDPNEISKIITLPKKLTGKARERYERLDSRKRDILKYASIMEHFSIQMLRDLIHTQTPPTAGQGDASSNQLSRQLSSVARGTPDSQRRSLVSSGGGGRVSFEALDQAGGDRLEPHSVQRIQRVSSLNSASGKGSESSGEGGGEKDVDVTDVLEAELTELIDLCVLERTEHIPLADEALEYIRRHDPQAVNGFTFQCRTLQMIVKSANLESNQKFWKARLKAMKHEARLIRSMALKHTQGVPSFGIRASAQFRAQEEIVQAITRRGSGSGPSPRPSPLFSDSRDSEASQDGSSPRGTQDSGEIRLHSVSSFGSNTGEGVVPFPVMMPQRQRIIDASMAVISNMVKDVAAKKGSRYQMQMNLEKFQKTSMSVMNAALMMLAEEEVAGEDTGVRMRPNGTLETIDDDEEEEGTARVAFGGADEDGSDVSSYDDDHDHRDSDAYSIGSFAQKLDMFEERFIFDRIVRRSSATMPMPTNMDVEEVFRENEQMRNALSEMIIDSRNFITHPRISSKVVPDDDSKRSKACTIL
jgi:hypothetical protein